MGHLRWHGAGQWRQGWWVARGKALHPVYCADTQEIHSAGRRADGPLDMWLAAAVAGEARQAV